MNHFTEQEANCSVQPRQPIIQVLGDIFTDICARIPNEGLNIGGDTLSKIDTFAGGSALNVAMHIAHYLRRQKEGITATAAAADDTRSHPLDEAAKYGPPQEGLGVAMFSCVGNDEFGAMCSKALQTGGVCTNGVKTSKKGLKTGTCIVLSSEMDRSFVTDGACVSQELDLPLFISPFITETEAPSSSAAALSSSSCCCTSGSTAACPSAELFQNPACHLHVSGMYNLSLLRQQDIPAAQAWDGLNEVYARAKHVGMSTSLNPQYDNLGRWDGIERIAKYIDVLIANEGEILRMANPQQDGESFVAQHYGSQKEIDTEGGSAMSSAEKLKNAAGRLLGWGIGLVVVTQGNLGATAFAPLASIVPHTSAYVALRKCLLPLPPSLEGVDAEQEVFVMKQAGYRLGQPVVDTTGAGDAFCGAFLGSLLSHHHCSAMQGLSLKANQSQQPYPRSGIANIPFLPIIHSHVTAALLAGCEAGARACMCLGGSTVVPLREFDLFSPEPLA